MIGDLISNLLPENLPPTGTVLEVRAPIVKVQGPDGRIWDLPYKLLYTPKVGDKVNLAWYHITCGAVTGKVVL